MLATISLGLLALSTAVHAEDAVPVPVAIPIQARKLPQGHPLRRRALGPIEVPLDDFFLGTDLQWFGNISVGTPPQDVSVVFDTGSSTLEFGTTECASCAQKNKFDISKSSTFVRGNQRTSISFATGVGVDPVINNDYVLQLRSGTDTITVGGVAIPNIALFTITDQTPKFNIEPFIGIQGMSAVAQGFFAGLVSRGLPSLFSMFLTPNAVGNAELTLGGIDTTKFKGDLVFAPLSSGPRSSTWALASPSIAVNGKTTSTLARRRSIIFDSGTSNILFDTPTTEAMYALISPNIKPFAAEPGAYGLPCSQIGGLPATIDIAFTSQGGTPFNLTIPSSELNVGPFASDPSVCQTLINAFDGLELVGGSVLKHYYSVWDLQNRRMGFAPNGF